MRRLMRDEKGVVMLLLLVLSIPLFVFVVVPVIDVARAKYAASELRRITDTVCSVAAHETVSHMKTMKAFESQVRILSAPGAMKNIRRIESARLIAPTMYGMLEAGDTCNTHPEFGAYSGNQAFCRWPYSWRGVSDADGYERSLRTCDSESGSPYADFMGGDSVKKFGDITGVGCPDVTNDCELVVDTCKVVDEGTNDAPQGHEYASHFWSNVEDGGATIGCEITGIVDSVLPSIMTPSWYERSRKVVVRVAWSMMPQIIGTHQYDPSRPISFIDTNNTDEPANLPFAPLTIAIATEMITPPQTAFATEDARRYLYDPGLIWTGGGGATGSPDGTDTSPQGNYPAPLPDSDKPVYDESSIDYEANYDPLQGARLAFSSEPAPPVYPTVYATTGAPMQPEIMRMAPPPTPGQPYPTPAPPPAAMQDELKAACSGPAVSVRDLFASTLVELAARHGLLRFTTEVLHVNPQHDPTFGYANPPVLISRFGEDLAARQFQIPFVTVRASGVNGADNDGWTFPFMSTYAGSSPARYIDQRKDYRVAFQLRDCYHLYDGGVPGGTGIKRQVAPFLQDMLAEPLEPADPGAGTSPAADLPYSNVYSEEAMSPRPWAYSSGQAWDQQSPWPPDGVAPSNGSMQTRALTAAEVVSILGTTQACPTTGADTGDACTKNIGFGTGYQPDLIPDFVGMMSYLTRYSSNSDNPKSSGVGLRAPGLWYPNGNLPTESTIGANTPLPFGHSREVQTPNERSTVVVITHEAPTAAQAAVMANMIRDNGRVYKVIYIPNRPTNVTATRSAIRTAFGIGPNPQWFESEFFEFSPAAMNQEAIEQHKTPPYPTATDTLYSDAVFARYWADALNPNNGDMYVGARAANFFYERLLAKHVRY